MQNKIKEKSEEVLKEFIEERQKRKKLEAFFKIFEDVKNENKSNDPKE